MAAERIPLGSLEYVHIPLTTAPDNVTSMTVEMSIVTYPLHATSGDWKTAAWQSGAAEPTARLLIGPGTDLDLGLGTYVVRARVTATPEKPIIESGLIEIF